MNFALTEEQAMIREAAETFLADACTSEAVRAAMDSAQGYDAQVWQSLAEELGWCGLAVPEVWGGLGLGAVEVMLVQEQAGYRLLCAPFFSSVCVATTVLAQCGDDAVREDLLPQLAAGQCRMSMALPSVAEGFLASEVSAQSDGECWLLSGTLARVPDAQDVDQLLVVARAGDELGLFVVEATALSFEMHTTWDSSRRFSQACLSAVPARRCDGADLAAQLAHCNALVSLYIAAEQLGGAQRCLDLTVAYVAERKQFGRPVGSFQAVKHRAAQMMIQIEAARSAVYGAAAVAAGQEAGLKLDVAAARALATEALQYCAGEAIQLHGGVGFTWEYDPQLFFKRGQASAHWLGNPQAQRAAIASALLD
ncbi:acyl-CoA dehydrogenase [Oceanococcus atlanticus]|uniref:Acyl-CoA dehydrogenase n=1 Tax=Oceanococcus atlanticus TaxID=1317117 RepID=A0A1Y1SFV8_9GAMM|nr:acyl-CoA dehydrogenase family protein [Oceanococcus atlanticus]ORE88554.1 acyl-CoA dehydrogenase [Oceanococcus atlanticus]